MSANENKETAVSPKSVEASGKSPLLQFGAFTLDLQRHGLYQGSKRVHLTSKPLETLAVLVEHHGKTVQKQQLLDAVWKEAFVTEDSLVKAVREIRRALGDEKASPQFIQTVPGEGYRFIAEVTRAEQTQKHPEPSPQVQGSMDAPGAVAIPAAVAGPRRIRFWITAAVIGLLTVVVAVISVRPSDTPEAPRQRSISSFPGSHTEASLSPDGKWLAFTSRESDNPAQVWLKNMPDGEPRSLTDGEIPSVHPRWSPKGDEIVFGRGKDWQQNIFSVSPFGGAPRLLIDGGRNPSWSSNGSRLVYEKDNEIWTANADGSGRQKLEGVPQIDLLVVDREPSFSPDGSQIAFFQPEDGPMGDIWVIPSRGGKARQLTFDNHLGGGPVWTNDGYIVFSSQRRGSKTLWKISESGGIPQPMTMGAGEDTSPEVSRDGARLIYTNSTAYWTLTLLDAATQQKQEIRETRTDMYFPKFSPAGDKIAFFATVDDGDIHIFTIRVDGSDLRQVTRGKGERNVMPQWSANGANLYFYQIRPGLSFRKISVEGGASSEIAPGWRPRTQYLARVDPAEKNVVYSKLEKGTSVATIIRDIATRQETPFKRTLDHARWSPDGRSIVGVDPASSTDGAHGDILVCPVDIGPCRKVASNAQSPVWSADDSQIYFERKMTEIWSVPPHGGEEKLVVHRSQVDPIAGEYDVSSQGKIVYVQFKQGRQGLWLADLR